MDAASEKGPINIRPATEEVGVVKPTSEEEIHDQAAQKIAHQSTEAGHPTTAETVKGGKVLTITPEMENIGIKPAGPDVSAKDVIRVATEDLIGAPEGTHRAGYGESGHGLYNIIERIKGKMKFKKAA